MHQQTKECTLFEADENVYLGLCVQDEKTNKNVLDCLYKLYADDCITWLIKKAGGNAKGEALTHNAHHAFSDSLLAINKSVKTLRFVPDGRPNSVRRFLYFVSKRYYTRLQANKYPIYALIPDHEDSSVFPKPHFEFPGEKEEKKRKLHEIIKNMPERCSKILWLKYVDGDITDEIEMKMNMNEDQVHKRLFDCREKLKEYISKAFYEKY